MNYYFEIDGETPSKKNSRITLKNGRTIPSKKFREWHKTQLTNIKKQNVGQEGLMLNMPLCIKLVFTHGDYIRRDSDNGVTSILDLLVDCKVLEDDNWKVVREIKVENKYEKNKANCKIYISHINN